MAASPTVVGDTEAGRLVLRDSSVGGIDDASPVVIGGPLVGTVVLVVCCGALGVSGAEVGCPVSGDSVVSLVVESPEGGVAVVVGCPAIGDPVVGGPVVCPMVFVSDGVELVVDRCADVLDGSLGCLEVCRPSVGP